MGKSDFFNEIQCEFLGLLSRTSIEDANNYLYLHPELLSSVDVEVITGIMTLMLINEAYLDCIHLGENVKEIFFNSDFYYNLGIAYQLNQQYDKAFSNLVYAMLHTSEKDYKEECYNTILSLLDDLISKGYKYLFFCSTGNFSRKNEYVFSDTKYKTVILSTKILDKVSPLEISNNYDLIMKIISHFNFVVLDNESLISNLIKEKGNLKNKVVQQNIGTDISTLELMNFYYKTLGIETSIGYLESLVFDFQFGFFEQFYSMGSSEYNLLLEIRVLLKNEEYDAVLDQVYEITKYRKVTEVLILFIVYIYVKKEDYFFSLFYINQLFERVVDANKDELIMLNKDILSEFRDLSFFTSKLNVNVVERELRCAYQNGILETEDIKSIVKRILPSSLIVETYRGCNLRCPLCVIQGYKNFSRQLSAISLDLFKKLMMESDLMNNIAQIYLHNLGEPLLNPSIAELITLIKTMYPKINVSMDSNLSLKFNIDAIVKSGIDEIVVAVDGFDQDTYEKYRINGDFQLVLNNIQNIDLKKKELSQSKPKLIAKSILFNHLDENRAKLHALIKSLPVDDFVVQAPLVFHVDDKRYNYEPYENWINIDSEYTRYKKTEPGSKIDMINKRNLYCNGITSSISPTINFDGNVFPCCVIGIDNKYTFGNINESTFLVVWQSDRYVSFRTNKLLGLEEDSLCEFCTMY